jgi:hypothetical protein
MAGPWAALAALLVSAGAAGPPAAGRYDARLCVTVSSQAPSCGPAEAHISADGELRVQVNDLAYHLSFDQGLLLGVTMHGNIQVAEFVSGYRWVGTTLLFADPPRGLQYEIQLGANGTVSAASAASR